jgi:hypothetical protein
MPGASCCFLKKLPGWQAFSHKQKNYFFLFLQKVRSKTRKEESWASPNRNIFIAAVFL